jgi:hypothetical protein
MKRTSWSLENVFGRNLARHALQHVAAAEAPVRVSSERALSYCPHGIMKQAKRHGGVVEADFGSSRRSFAVHLC